MTWPALFTWPSEQVARLEAMLKEQRAATERAQKEYNGTALQVHPRLTHIDPRLTPFDPRLTALDLSD